MIGRDRGGLGGAIDTTVLGLPEVCGTLTLARCSLKPCTGERAENKLPTELRTGEMGLECALDGGTELLTLPLPPLAEDDRDAPERK